MPKHVKYLLKHAAIGGAAALAFVALLLTFNVAGLWHLVTHTADGPIALAAMTIFFVITFGSVQMGRGIMALADDDDDHSGGRRDAIPHGQPIAIPVDTRR